MRLQDRAQKLRPDVHRERRTVAVAVVQPTGVIALEVSREVLPKTLLQCSECVLQSGLVRLAQSDFPFGELGDQLHPLAPGQRATATRLQIAEPSREVSGQTLLANAITVEKAGDH